jgi:hypothetical protein
MSGMSLPTQPLMQSSRGDTHALSSLCDERHKIFLLPTSQERPTASEADRRPVSYLSHSVRGGTCQLDRAQGRQGRRVGIRVQRERGPVPTGQVPACSLSVHSNFPRSVPHTIPLMQGVSVSDT